MARITRVAKAQPRYETKPVIDPETGQQKKVPVLHTKGPKKGEQIVTKRGPQFMRITERDLTRPKPLLKCDYPGCPEPNKEIQVGTPYKHISPRSGPYGGRQLNRHASCPDWNIWDYSSSIDARVAQVQSEGEDAIDRLEEEDDFDSILEEIKALAEELWQEKEESLNALPESLQETGELYERVQALEEWVNGFDDADRPDFPEAESTVTRYYVTGPDGQSLDEQGFDTKDEALDELETWLRNHPDEDEDDWQIEDQEEDVEDPEIDEDELEEWRESAKEALRDVLNAFEG